MSQTKGRVTIPTNLDVVPETIELMKRWGADAIRDCDGTEFPEELTKTGAKIYASVLELPVALFIASFIACGASDVAIILPLNTTPVEIQCL